MRKVYAFITLALLFLAFVAFAITFGHAATTGKNRANSLGVIIPDDNQNIYMFGMPVDGKVFECAKDEICTNVAFRPYNTDMLHTESVLFCGNEEASFKGKKGALVVTYRRQGSRNYGGVSCHDLTSVFEVAAPPPEKF